MQAEIKAILKKYPNLKIDLKTIDNQTVLFYIKYYLSQNKPAELYRDKNSALKIRPIEKVVSASITGKFTQPDAELSKFQEKMPGQKNARLHADRVISEVTAGHTPVGFMLTGQNAVGKTFLLRALATALRHKNTEVLHVFPIDLFTYANPVEPNNRKYLELFKNTPVLILDDIGTEQGADWLYKSVLVPILEHRLNYRLTTIFSSNFNLKEYYKKISEKTGDVQLALQICSKIKILTGKNIVEIA